MRGGRPTSSPAPDVCPIRGQGAGRAASSAAVPSAARYAANSGSTSPCSAQSSSVADSSVVRSSTARGPRVGHVVGRAGRSRRARRASRRARRRRAGSGRRRCRRGRAGRAVDACGQTGSSARLDHGRVGGEPGLRPVGGAAPPHASGSPPDRTLPRSIRGTRTSTNRPIAEGVTGQTQGPALNIGAQRVRGEHRWATRPRRATGEPQRARHLGGPGGDDADAAAGDLDVQRGRACGAAPGPGRRGRCAGARPPVSAR